MNLPAQVNTALALLRQAGFEAYVVGGAVRDSVLGRAGSDFDLTTSAPPVAIERVFQACRLIETGLKHGTVTVLLDGMPLEITTFRRDGAYTDRRHPDSVAFSASLEEDLARRDFTMNAMAYCPQAGLIDPYGGQRDLRAGLVRCVGRAEQRFQEDALRILRALRFAATLDMNLDPQTAEAAHRCAPLLHQIAAERVQAELTKLLCGNAASRVLDQFRDIVAVLLPELSPTFAFAQHSVYHDKDVWDHCLAAMQTAPADPVLRWAALLHDVGKPACFTMDETGAGHFYGHAEMSAAITETVLQRLRFDAASRTRIVALVKNHDLPLSDAPGRLKRLLSRFGEDTLRQLLAIHRADTLAHAPACHERLCEYDRFAQALDALLLQKPCFTLKDLAVNGHDMMALGLRGKAVGAALRLCLEAVIDETAPNQRQVLLALVRAQMQL